MTFLPVNNLKDISWKMLFRILEKKVMLHRRILAFLVQVVGELNAGTPLNAGFWFLTDLLIWDISEEIWGNSWDNPGQNIWDKL